MGFVVYSGLRRLEREFWKAVEAVRDEAFRRKVERFLRKAFKRLEKEGLNFFEAPAGRSQHHAYAGGLAQHTLSMLRIALAMVENLARYYGFRKVNRDYVVAGALLHDLYKPLTYRVREDGGYEFSRLGNRLDHLTMLVADAGKAGFPLDFLHVLAASHGEWGPMPPRTLEALIVHLADLADSRFAGQVGRAAQNILRGRGKPVPSALTVKEALKVIVEGEA
ncbi:MAG: HD domain-containing protein [Candidatus Hecatellaceae archaeon]|nr:MAG: dihydroneopterin 2',3'-cyclic phosphate phosphodiesterase [Candidatus Hecatellales archaeon]